MDDVVDAQIVDDTPPQTAATAGSAVAVRSAASAVPDIRARMQGIIESTGELAQLGRLETQSLRQIVLTILDVTDFEGRPPAVNDKGWAKVAKRLKISREIVPGSVQVRYINGAEPLAATVIVRAHFDGAFEDGDGHCDINEDTFTDRATGAAKEGGRAKLEHMLVTRATSRAKKRAIESVLGIGKITPNDVRQAHQQAGLNLQFGPAFSAEQSPRARRAMLYLVDGDEDVLDAAIAATQAKCGYFPACVADALVKLAVDLRASRDVATPPETARRAPEVV